MLSRVAESMYWMCRYVERAENIARFVDVNLHLTLDLPSDLFDQWSPVVSTTGDLEWFEEHYGDATESSVIRFLTLDRSYPNSIISCIRNARENARSIREIISSEMWEQINTLYLFVEGAAAAGELDEPYSFFRRIRMSCHLFKGLMEETMSHGEPWQFGCLGEFIERADKTSRILDIKYFILLPDVKDVGTPFDNIQWSALLSSASALEMYRKRWRRIDSTQVVAFLLLDNLFPRSVRYSVAAVEDALHGISGAPAGTYSNPAEMLVGRLRSDLDYARIDDIIRDGLHEFCDSLQAQLNRVDEVIFNYYFALRPGSDTAPGN